MVGIDTKEELGLVYTTGKVERVSISLVQSDTDDLGSMFNL